MEAVMAMYDNSRALMRADGNRTQWVGYPTREGLAADMAAGVSYVIEDEGRVVGTFALVDGEEPTYGVITGGRWIDDSPYATIHRVARTREAHGVAEEVFRYAKGRFQHLRIDTHASNRAMRHIIEKEGFVYCGTVYMNDGSERMAYEWRRWDCVEESLREYVEECVLPQYDAFDAAHRRDHARRVIARAMAMEPSAKTYVAAAMHDIGLTAGRERHHEESGRKIRDERKLEKWFSASEIEEIAQAAEDHRASAERAPRTRLGCVVAEADRDVEPLTIVRRTVEYGLSHYAELDREGHWRRTVQHLEEKYSERGYIKLWLEDSPNAAPLEELRALIADKGRLREVFDELIIEN